MWIAPRCWALKRSWSSRPERLWTGTGLKRANPHAGVRDSCWLLTEQERWEPQGDGPEGATLLNRETSHRYSLCAVCDSFCTLPVAWRSIVEGGHHNFNTSNERSLRWSKLHFVVRFLMGTGQLCLNLILSTLTSWQTICAVVCLLLS